LNICKSTWKTGSEKLITSEGMEKFMMDQQLCITVLPRTPAAAPMW
jgi:hypothetical protein